MPIYFCGDISIDNYESYTEFASPKAPEKIIVRQFGGAYLLARFTAVIWSILHGPNKRTDWLMGTLQPWSTLRTQLNERLDRLFANPREFDHNWQISYRLQEYGNEYRVPRSGHEGVTVPQNKSPDIIGARELPLNTDNDIELFVLNDRGADARDDQSLADAIATEKDNWVVIKILNPPEKGEVSPLLTALLKSHPEKLIVIIPADELRKSGMPISRSLSWERSFRDVVEEIRSGELFHGNMPPHLVITFDYDAALYLRTSAAGKKSNKRVVEAGSIVFSIGGAEGEFESKIEGDMPGAQTAFVSVLTALLYGQLVKGAKSRGAGGDPLTGMATMLSCALIAKRRLLRSGFAVDPRTKRPYRLDTVEIAGTKRSVPRLLYSEGIFSLQAEPRVAPDDPFGAPPDPSLRSEKSSKRRDFYDPFLHHETFKRNLADQDLAVHDFTADNIPIKNWNDWSIFKEVAKHGRLASYADYVIQGVPPKHIPICSFGKIKTAEFHEIEDFRTVANLLQSYLSNPSASRPLGIAVFGPPGSGKSFAVKNIVETLPEAIKRLTKDDRHECNLTALSDPEDLAHYFQLARNSVLRGKVPMLFFDEFDCTVGNTPFFWLKHFLAPLQDGEFRSNQIVHPLGRVIFVFAGGVYDKFAEFASEMQKNSNSSRGSEAKKKKAGNQPNFKGVDFLSRLHGHIDIAPFSPAKNAKAFYPSSKNNLAVLVDPSYLMRRAFVLRSLLEMHLSEIFSRGSPRLAGIDRRIVNALLATKSFSHGARSMEAIIRMSVLEGSDHFEISHLPPDNQLKMHVNSDNFNYCLERDVEAIWWKAAKRAS
jgi:hypothetical protein